MIIKTLKQNWAKYLLEVIAIIVGILGAFMLDSWHDDRKALQIEREKYSKMISDLKEDLKIIEASRSDAIDHQEIHYQIFNEIIGDSLFNEDLNYDYIIFPIIHTSHFQDNHKGSIDEIKDVEVLDKVNRYFTSYDRLQASIDYYSTVQSDQLTQYFINNGVYDLNNTFSQKGFYNFTTEQPILNHERIMLLKDDKRFRGHLSHLRMYTEYVILRATRQIKATEELIAFLEMKLSE